MHKFAKLFVESTEMQGGLEVKSSTFIPTKTANKFRFWNTKCATGPLEFYLTFPYFKLRNSFLSNGAIHK